jgi:protein-S-isoprenylcysteine O-methyltransferase Ste14
LVFSASTDTRWPLTHLALSVCARNLSETRASSEDFQMQLFIGMLRTAIIGLIVFGALIFVPAGTLAYWRGWAFIAVFAISTNIIGVYLTLNDPVLLERRKKVGPSSETRPVQKIIITLSFAAFIMLLIVSGLDHRFGWSQVPVWVSVLGNALVALGLMIDLRVFRENSYGGSTIEMTKGQTVITSGPYALVRHPMYVGVVIMVLGVPLALGSWWGLVLVLASLVLLVLRILDEERMLRDQLEGYAAYARAVRYRLVPGLW